MSSVEARPRPCSCGGHARSHLARQLSRAVQDLSMRAMHIAASWAAEQLCALERTYVDDDERGDAELMDQCVACRSIVDDLYSPMEHIHDPKERALVQQASALLTLGEYQRCMHMLRSAKGSPSKPPSSPELTSDSHNRQSPLRFESPLYCFLMCYSRYLTGEKLKDQAEAEGVTAGNGADASSAGILNPFLTDIFVELYPKYRANALDGHCLYLFGVVVRELKLQGCTNASGYQSYATIGNISESLAGLVVGDIFMASVALYPYNWSCWLEINALIVQSNQAEAVVSYLLTPAPHHTEPLDLNDGDHVSSGLDVQKAKFYFDVRRTMSASLYKVATPSASITNGSQLAYINHPMQLFFLASCLVDLHPYAGLAMDVIAMLRGSVAGVADCSTSAGPAAASSSSNSSSSNSSSSSSSNLASSPPTSNDVRNNVAFDLSPYVLVQEALALYSNRDYDGSLVCFEALRERHPYRLEHLDTYSNILYVKEMRAELCYLAHVLQKVDKFHPATCSVIGNYYSLKRNHERAIIYFQRALKLNPDFSSAWTLMGHEYVELRNANAAVHCYRQAVKFTPGCHSNDYRAWYGLGQAYEMLHLFGYALFYYDKAASLRPTDARMWCAVGKCLYKLSSSGSGLGASLTGSNAWANQRYAALLAYERAVQCGDSEGVATRELAKMYREFGNKPSAALCYVKYLALQDRLNARSHDDVEDQFAEDATSAAPSANTHHAFPPSNAVSMHKDEDALTPYVQSMPSSLLLDEFGAEACEFVAHYLFQVRKYRLAAKCCARLVEFPGPEGDRARSLLREIQSKSKHESQGFQ